MDYLNAAAMSLNALAAAFDVSYFAQTGLRAISVGYQYAAPWIAVFLCVVIMMLGYYTLVAVFAHARAVAKRIVKYVTKRYCSVVLKLPDFIQTFLLPDMPATEFSVGSLAVQVDRVTGVANRVSVPESLIASSTYTVLNKGKSELPSSMLEIGVRLKIGDSEHVIKTGSASHVKIDGVTGTFLAMSNHQCKEMQLGYRADSDYSIVVSCPKRGTARIVPLKVCTMFYQGHADDVALMRLPINVWSLLESSATKLKPIKSKKAAGKIFALGEGLQHSSKWCLASVKLEADPKGKGFGFAHTTSTVPTMSGTPIYDVISNSIVAIHLAGGPVNGSGYTDKNYGSSFAVLFALLKTSMPRPESEDDWEERSEQNERYEAEYDNDFDDYLDDREMMMGEYERELEEDNNSKNHGKYEGDDPSDNRFSAPASILATYESKLGFRNWSDVEVDGAEFGKTHKIVPTKSRDPASAWYSDSESDSESLQVLNWLLGNPVPQQNLPPKELISAPSKETPSSASIPSVNTSGDQPSTPIMDTSSVKPPSDLLLAPQLAAQVSDLTSSVKTLQSKVESLTGGLAEALTQNKALLLISAQSGKNPIANILDVCETVQASGSPSGKPLEPVKATPSSKPVSSDKGKGKEKISKSKQPESSSANGLLASTIVASPKVELKSQTTSVTTSSPSLSPSLTGIQGPVKELKEPVLSSSARKREKLKARLARQLLSKGSEAAAGSSTTSS
jgi:hypothetical protein